MWSEIIGGGLALAGGLSSRKSQKEANALTREQLAISRDQLKMAREQWDYYKTNYQPLEQDIIRDAREGIQADYGNAVGRASLDVQQSLDKQRDITNRNISRYGINPNSGRFYALNRDMTLGGTAAEAGARTLAREREKNRVEDTNYTRKVQAMSLGKGLPTQASANMSSASAGMGMGAANYNQSAALQGQNAYNTAKAVSSLPWDSWIKDWTGGGGSGGGALMGPANAGAQGSGVDYGADAWGSDESMPESAMNYGLADGGLVRGPGTETSDSIQARLSDGEYVIPAAVVRAKGVEFFDKIVQSNRDYGIKRSQPQRRFAEGGEVRADQTAQADSCGPAPPRPNYYSPQHVRDAYHNWLMCKNGA